MQEFVEAIQSGDYEGAYVALGKTAEANTAIGTASGAFLLALTGRYDEAYAMLQGCGAPAIELIVQGERARWLDVFDSPTARSASSPASWTPMMRSARCSRPTRATACCTSRSPHCAASISSRRATSSIC